MSAQVRECFFDLEVKAVKKKLMIALASLAVIGAAVAAFLHRSR